MATAGVPVMADLKEYRAEEITFLNPSANVSLAGTLTLPPGDRRYPAVVLIHGSGPLDRDESIAGHKLFRALSECLAGRGIAVLRFDKRGVGHSTGDLASATTLDLASDVVAAVSWLKRRPDVDTGKIGLIGYSEGGLIAPMVAAQDASLAFIVLMAAPGLPGHEIMSAQHRLAALAAGMSDAEAERVSAINAQAHAAICENEEAEAGIKIRNICETSGLELSSDAIEAAVKELNTNWWRFFLSYDPVPTLRRVKCPVLAMNGTKDLQVTASENLGAIAAALAHNPDVEVKELRGLNHLFQTARTGAPREYGEIKETIAPCALDLLTRWIEKHIA